MAEDILHEANLRSGQMGLPYNDIFSRALIILQDKINTLDGCDLKGFGLPQSQDLDFLNHNKTQMVFIIKKFSEKHLMIFISSFHVLNSIQITKVSEKDLKIFIS